MSGLLNSSDRVTTADDPAHLAWVVKMTDS